MADEEKPAPPPASSDDAQTSYGCFSIVLLLIVTGAMYKLFELAGPSGSLGAGIASFGLAALGFGILYLGVKYLRSRAE